MFALSLAVAILASVVIHEAAHAIAIAVLGLKFSRIRIGAGPLVKLWQLADIPIEVRAWPVSAAVAWAPTEAHRYVQRRFITTAAGLAATLILLCLGVALWSTPIGPAVVVANAGLFIENAWPYRSRLHGPNRPRTDGGTLINIVRGRERLPDGYLAARATELAAQTGGQHLVIQLWEDANAKSPTTYSRMALIDACIAAHLWTKVEQLSRSELRSADLSPKLRAVLLNNVAWTLLISHDPPRIEDAYRTSQEALQIDPDSIPVQGTNGFALALHGDGARSVEILQAVLQTDLPPSSRAEVLAALALARHVIGDHEAASHHLQEAIKADPSAKSIPIVEARLS